MNWDYDQIMISTDPKDVDFNHVYNFLKDAYWCEGIPRELVRKAIDNSLSFSILHPDGFIGFARLVTDHATFAYLADVYVEEKYRGQGFGHLLIKSVNNWLETHSIRTALLLTRDAQSLYNSHGWVYFQDIKRIMRYKERKHDFYSSFND